MGYPPTPTPSAPATPSPSGDWNGQNFNISLTGLGSALAPTLSAITPANGPVAGGQSVTLTGTNLTATSAVSFGGTPAASFSVVDAGTVKATTPAHAGGPVNVTVTTPGGVSNPVLYTYQFLSSTTVAGSPNPSAVGASLTFTVTVAPAPDGATAGFTNTAVPFRRSSPTPATT